LAVGGIKTRVFTVSTTQLTKPQPRTTNFRNKQLSFSLQLEISVGPFPD